MGKIYGKLTSHWKIRGMFQVLLMLINGSLVKSGGECFSYTSEHALLKSQAKGYSMKLPSPVDRTKRLQQHLDLRPASPASGISKTWPSHLQRNQALRSDSQPLPGFSAQKPLEPPAASNITGVTQVSTMIRMAKKQSKLNLDRNRLLHVALSHPRYKNGTWGR